MIQTIVNTLIDWATRLTVLATKIAAISAPDLTAITDEAAKVETALVALEAAVAAHQPPVPASTTFGG